jgi:hypothetical protein
LELLWKGAVSPTAPGFSPAFELPVPVTPRTLLAARVVEVPVPARRHDAAELGLLEEAAERGARRFVVQAGVLDHPLLLFDPPLCGIELIVLGLELVFELRHPVLHLAKLLFDVRCCRELRRQHQAGGNCDE